MAGVELQSVGPYSITRLLAEGPSSRFYLAMHQQRKKDAVIKVLLSPLTAIEAKEAFLARARSLKRLKHRNIVEVMDYGFTSHSSAENDLGYLVLQYTPGGSIRERIAPGQHIAADEAKRILSPLADALHYSHVNNIVHGNLHPGNVLVGERNETLLSDFSLRLQDVLPSFEGETAALPYKAPQHLQGKLSAASDQYSLAVMLYEWLCGRRPYEASEAEALLNAQLHEPLPPLRGLNPHISPAVEMVVMQALAVNPEERFQHTLAFSHAYLHALMGLPVKVETQRITLPTPTNTLNTKKSTEKKSTNTGNPSKENSTRRISVSPIPTPGQIESKTIGSEDKVDETVSTIVAPSIAPLSPISAEKISPSRDVTRAPEPTPKLSPSDQLLNRQYRIIGSLGQGGMATVYKVEDTKFNNRFLAIKQMNQSGLSQQQIGEKAEAFKQEADILANLMHPNLPRIYDYFNEDGHWYLVMDFIEGETLEDYLDKTSEGRLTVEEVLNIGIDLCNVLNYLHTHQPPFVFRDLKPSNIMRTPNGHIYLIDFGIARHFKAGKVKDTTTLGTPGYAAPEQFGESRTTPRTDIYNLGVTLHELLTGDHPSLLLFHFTPLGIDIPELDRLIMQMVEKDENRRPAGANGIKQELQYIATKYSAKHTSISQPLAFKGSQLPIILRQPDSQQAAQGVPSARNTLYDSTTEDLANQTPIVDNKPKGSPASIRFIMPQPSAGSDLESIVTADLCQGGILSQRLPGYEERPAQIEMARLIARSLMEGLHVISEASTGTGKSLAYLLPIVRSGRVAIISTANKALQEQLFYKDIPFVQKHIEHFDAALVKGMGNYVCLDRLEEERNGIQYYTKNRDFMRLLAMTEDTDSTFDGDFEMLGFPLPGDIRSRVLADKDQCAWSKCNFFADCYVRKMKVRASNAKIIVVNHTLLLLDAAMGGYLLPERDVIVVDEAHHLEEEATRCFTVTVSPLQVTTLLAQRMLKEHTPASLQDEANAVMMMVWERLAIVADPGFKGRANLQAPLEEGLRLATLITDMANILFDKRPTGLPEKESQLYEKLIVRTQNLAESIRMVFSVDRTDEYVYYVERINAAARRGGQLQVSAAPLDVSTLLQAQLFGKSKVICTSATLATAGPNPRDPDDKGPNFGYFRRRTGLDPALYRNTLERILPLTFDYESNALLYLPRDLPEPAYGNSLASTDYAQALAQRMFYLVKASRGRAFLLFSSKRMLEAVYDLFLELYASELDYPLLRQGDLTRIELTRKFREEEGAILFGLKSFWEGVDIAGEALSLVVIDKLPFDPPDDPVHEARVARMKAAGENWFGTYVLPQAVLRLKQGLGRLLRAREDRGVMAILDTRLYTKSYGRTILSALPPARRTTSLKDVERFFDEEPAPF